MGKKIETKKKRHLLKILTCNFIKVVDQSRWAIRLATSGLGSNILYPHKKIYVPYNHILGKTKIPT